MLHYSCFTAPLFQQPDILAQFYHDGKTLSLTYWKETASLAELFVQRLQTDRVHCLFQVQT